MTLSAMKSTAGLQKIAEGREAEMFAWEGGAVLRLLRNPEAQTQVQWEVAAMEAARSRGVRVPAVFGTTAVLGRPGIIMERIAGADLLTVIGRRPWTVFRAGRLSGAAHAALHEVRSPDSIPPLRESMRWRIEQLPDLPEPLKKLSLDVLQDLPDGDRLCHFDFHPANLMMDGDTPVLIDWTNVRRGDPAADVARTLVILRLGEPPPGTSPLLKLMTLAGRNILVSLYLRAYRRHRPLDMALVARWQVPVAAARLADDIPEERRAILRLLDRARTATRESS